MGESAGGSTTGTRTAVPPDATAVIRAVRIVRDLVNDMAPRGDPIRCAILPADDVVPLLDRVIELLEELSRPTASRPDPGRG